MILRGVRILNWHCIGKLELADLPAGVVVLYGPNRTGKTSLVRALRACLFDHEAKTGHREIKASVPWTNLGPPQVAVEFETGGRSYRITKVYSTKTDGSAVLESKRDSQWQKVESAHKEAHARTLELLGASSSTGGLNQLLWLSQGETALPRGKELDGSLQQKLVGVLGMMVTGEDLAFKEKLNDRYQEFFTDTGRDSKNAPHCQAQKLVEERRATVTDLERKFREIEHVIVELQNCEEQLPRLERELDEAREEVRNLEAEREQTRQRRFDFEQAERDMREATNLLIAAQRAQAAFWEAKDRWQNAEQKAVRAEEEAAAAGERKQGAAEECERLSTALQAAQQAEIAHQQGREEIADRRRLLTLATDHSRLANDLARGRKLSEEIAAREAELGELTAPSEKEIEALRQNRRQAIELRSRLEAEALALTVTLQQSVDVRLSCDGESAQERPLHPGRSQQWSFRQRATIEFPGLAGIQITRGQEDLDLEAAANQLKSLDHAFRDSVLGHGGDPSDERCLEALLARRQQRIVTMEGLKNLRAELQRLAPNGLSEIEAGLARTNKQQLAIFDRRPEMKEWRGSEDEVQQLEDAFNRQANNLHKTRALAEAAAKAAAKVLAEADSKHQTCRDIAVEIKTTAQMELEAMKRLGDEHSLQRAVETAKENVQRAEQRVESARLTEAEQTVEQRYLAAQHSLEQRQKRLQSHREEMSGLRRLRQGNEGLHSRLADAEIALREAEESFERLSLEATACKRLHDLFEECRDSQVRTVMGPIGERVLTWAKYVGLNDYEEVRFGDDFLPEGVVTERSPDGKVRAFGDESFGTEEQLGVLVRLALGGVLAQDEPAAAILDDPLAHSDRLKHDRLLHILAQAAEGNRGWMPPAGQLQIIILTCHPERFDHLPGAKMIDLTRLITRVG